MSNWVDSTNQAPYEFHLSKVLSKSLELPKNATSAIARFMINSNAIEKANIVATYSRTE